MTVIIHIGRRVPKNWFKRQVSKAKGLMTFQENIWQMIKQSMLKAKKNANSSNTGIKFSIQYPSESEDIHYNIEWIKVMVQGSKEQEQEEFDEANMMYKSLGAIIKKEVNLSDMLAGGSTDLKKQIKTGVLSMFDVEDAYKKGYGALNDDTGANIANKLLEMGIITHIKKIDDFDSREPYYPGL